MKKLFLILTLLCSNSFAALTDLKIGSAQIHAANGYYFSGGSYWLNSVSAPAGGTFLNMTTVQKNTLLANMKANEQYFKFTSNSTTTVDYSLSLMNKDGTVNSVISTTGDINLSTGLIIYRPSKTTNAAQHLIIFPNNGFDDGNLPNANKEYKTRNLSPTIAQLDSYIPPSAVPFYFNGTMTQSVPIGTGIAGGGVTATYASSISTTQQTQLTGINTRLGAMTDGNKLYVEEKIGTTGSIVNIEQVGKSNIIQGIGGGNATIEGTSNTINIKQGSSTGKNMAEFGIKGNSNSLTIWQARNITDGTTIMPVSDLSQHYASASITGNTNTVTIKQSNGSLANGTGSGHFESLTVTGNTNTVALTQNESGQKQFWGTIIGNSNILNVVQQGASTKYLDLTLNGASNNATVSQVGTGAHKATIALTNGGGASTLNLTQQGTTAQIYSISQTCAVATGCSATLVQGQ